MYLDYKYRNNCIDYMKISTSKYKHNKGNLFYLVSAIIFIAR